MTLTELTKAGKEIRERVAPSVDFTPSQRAV
jgi:hypothetical protein